MCGEKFTFNFYNTCKLGSPPRVRGKADSVTNVKRNHRITPACAGKSEKGLIQIEYLEDHPRVCGEKPLFPLFPRLISGSPPRVRGKGFENVITLFQKRITPACAGKRTLTYAGADVLPDHPRVCGEKQ